MFKKRSWVGLTLSYCGFNNVEGFSQWSDLRRSDSHGLWGWKKHYRGYVVVCLFINLFIYLFTYLRDHKRDCRGYGAGRQTTEDMGPESRLQKIWGRTTDYTRLQRIWGRMTDYRGYGNRSQTTEDLGPEDRLHTSTLTWTSLEQIANKFQSLWPVIAKV